MASADASIAAVLRERPADAMALNHAQLGRIVRTLASTARGCARSRPRVMGTSVRMIERHYGALLDGDGASIAGRRDAIEAKGDRSEDVQATTGPRRAVEAVRRAA